MIGGFFCARLEGSGANSFATDAHCVVTNATHNDASIRCQADAGNDTGRAQVCSFDNTGLLCRARADSIDQRTNVIAPSWRSTSPQRAREPTA